MATPRSFTSSAPGLVAVIQARFIVIGHVLGSSPPTGAGTLFPAGRPARPDRPGPWAPVRSR